MPAPSFVGPAFTAPDIAGQSLLPIGSAALHIHRSERRVPSGPDLRREDPLIESRWSALCAANPRYHDGDILSVAHIDGPAGRIEVATDRFRDLAVQSDDLDLSVRLLGVKGLITAQDSAGHEHMLIARRSTETRIYHAMWEIAPAGGVNTPQSPWTNLGPETFADALAEEAREELGLTIDPAGTRPVAIVIDETARSVDVIVAHSWPHIINPKKPVACAAGCTWEYLDTCWLSRDDAQVFDRDHAASIVPVMRIALRWLGWTTKSVPKSPTSLP